MPPTAKPIKHGTLGGWKVHKNRGEEVCEACAGARREYDRMRRRIGTVLKGNRVTMSLETFAEIWFAADDSVLQTIDAELGTKVVDAVIEAVDRRKAS